MKPELAGFSESFNPRFDLVVSMIEKQRRDQEHEAHPESERSLHGIKGWLASIIVGFGALGAIGCDKAPDQAPKPETSTAHVESHQQPSRVETDFMTSPSKTIGIINEQGFVDPVHEEQLQFVQEKPSIESKMMSSHELKVDKERQSKPIEASVVEKTLEQTMLSLSHEYAILDTNETAFKLIGDSEFHVVTGAMTGELEKVVAEGLRIMRNFNEQGQSPAAKLIQKQMNEKIKEIVSSGKTLSSTQIPHDKKKTVELKLSKETQKEIDKL